MIEAKKAGVPLIEVEIQSGKYSQGLPENLPAPRRPLPFCYQSTGVETRFTNLLEPDARSRPVFGFHRPETLAAWLEADLKSPGSTMRGRLRIMPPLPREGLWDHQHRVIANLEQSLARNDPRALIHMTMGSGKTFTACNFVYRLIAHAGARRVLFLVDRRTLGRQALNEFQQFSIPGDGRKFTEIYNVQLLSANTIDPVCPRRHHHHPAPLFHPERRAGLTYNPRIVVTGDMIATGTDVRPLEILFFLRDVRSLNYFEQMKGRGVRVLSSDELRGVTPDAETKDHFVIVDAVGVTDRPQIESRPLERQPHVPLHKLLEAVVLGSTDKEQHG